MKILKKLFFIFVIAGSTTIIKAQTSFVVSESGSSISVSGTSNLHDYELISNEIKGNASLFIEDGKITDIKKVVITLKTESLESSKAGLKRNAMKSLQPEANPIISFIAFEMPSVGKVSGILNVAGYDSDKEIDYTSEWKDGKLYVSAKCQVKFTDFQLEPPSALAGTVKAKDELLLDMMIVFEEEK